MHTLLYISMRRLCRVLLQRVAEVESEVSSLKEASRASLLTHKAVETKLRLQVRDARVNCGNDDGDDDTW